MNPNQKRAAIEALPTEQIEKIIASVEAGPEHLKAPSADYPLAGQVRIEGIGHVEVRALRRVLASRRKSS